MDGRAWRVAGGSGAALLVLVALVAWRADSLAGGWLLALRLTGVVAVVGLLAAVVLASLAALRPPTAPEVLVRVSAAGAPQTTTRPGRKALVPLTAVLLLAVLASAPVLVVLVLATGPRQGAAPDPDLAGGEPGGEAETSAPPPSSSTSPAPSSSAPTSPAPSSSAPAPSTEPGKTGQTPAPVSPSQLPSTAASPAVCSVVVVAGDTLWGIARTQLGADASDADVDARWRALYARNTDAVGSDPDLVRPGLALQTCA